MLKRPSSRRRSKSSEVIINLVPMLDALVTLIGFLLFSMSFLSLVSVETPMPQISQEDVQKKITEKPLQLTVSIRDKETEIWSPFQRIKAQSIPHNAEGLPDTAAIHAALIELKKQFVNENKVVLVPEAGTSYDILVAVMDAVRTLEPTDPAIFRYNETTGNDEPLKGLFSEIIFGNLLGEG